jgi:NADPH-dependent 2,4-dienoyl-CoA reductase/sulfur reductase-like enzyme
MWRSVLTRNAKKIIVGFDRKFHRICIVGSGPSGFYCAKYLLERKTGLNNVSVDMYDRLPTPFGLVRYGVAPDHPEVKSVEEQFAEVIVFVPQYVNYISTLYTYVCNRWLKIPISDISEI